MSEHTYLEPPADRTVKIPHLVFGLLFLGVAAIWALVVSDLITADRLTVLAPAVLIGAGVVGLAASLASGRNRRHRRTAHTVADEFDDRDDRDSHEDTSTYPTSTYPTSTYPTSTYPTSSTDDEPTEEIR